MAMNAGSVTLDGDGNPTGTGLARELYDAWIAKVSFPDPDDYPEADRPKVIAAIVAGKGGLADQCDAFASAVVAHITTNAAVTIKVDTGDAGLQRLPANLAEDEPTKAPSAQKTLATKGSVA